MSTFNRGLFWGFISYTLWGFFPVYWKLLADRSSLEILAHRMVWSFVFYLAIFMATAYSDLPKLLQQNRRDWLYSAIAAALLTLNWGLYIYAVNSGHILEGSLAYFINPILNVAIGVVLFREPFPLILRLSVGAAFLGVLYKMLYAPGFPWIALILAFSFCAYGVTKKVLKIPARTSSVLEGVVGVIPALIAVAYFQTHNEVPASAGTWLLFILGGVVTGLPLFLFSFAAQRVSYSIMGMLQFIAPSLQFLVAVLIFNETMSDQDLISFVLIWVGIGFYFGHQFMSLHQRRSDRSKTYQ